LASSSKDGPGQQLVLVRQNEMLDQLAQVLQRAKESNARAIVAHKV